MNKKHINALVVLLTLHNKINDKKKLTKIVMQQFNLTKDRSVYYCPHFAIRFSASTSKSFSNTVLALSTLQKFDDRPFIVCLVRAESNDIYLANSTFLKKVSHSSQELTVNNIKGSFNGSDIIRNFEGISNTPENIEWLFNIHANVSFEENLIRLVEATNNISPTGTKFEPTAKQLAIILGAPVRAKQFISSQYAEILKKELDAKVSQLKNEILLAALIENVNIRGRVIEYLIAGENEQLKAELIHAIKKDSDGIPAFKTKNTLGDYTRIFDAFSTETDVKTKIMILHSNPKAYNLDKMLEFLSTEKSVFLFYFVGIEPLNIVNTILVSLFQEDLLRNTILLRHWAGRNSRGVSQFEGKTISDLILSPSNKINEIQAKNFLEKILALTSTSDVSVLSKDNIKE